jgi:hypothetical protein
MKAIIIIYCIVAMLGIAVVALVPLPALRDNSQSEYVKRNFQ